MTLVNPLIIPAHLLWDKKKLTDRLKIFKDCLNFEEFSWKETRNKEMEKVSIQDFYSGRSVFITGVTGFMGKVLVEKLLRSCPGVDRLYLLIRPTSGKNILVRLQELINCKVFEWLKQNQPDALEKLVPINGDVSLPDLGLSLSDMQELSDNVSVVFHSAARVKFDNDLRSSLEMNVRGPQRMANFCKQFKKLKAFVYVSTTFNNLENKEIAEEIYPASVDPQKLVDLIDSMDDLLLASITKQLVGKCPNVYAYTKALGEKILRNLTEREEHKLLIVIVRPSIVTGAIQEPLAGWIDNFNGPSGLVAGVGKGLIQTVKAGEKLIADLVPVDIAINLMIAVAWHKGTSDKPSEPIEVYNCSSGSLNPITWGEFRRLGLQVLSKFPFKEIMRCPGVELRSSWIVYQIELAFYHHLPALLADTTARLCGKKPFLTRLYKRTHTLMSCLEFYTSREWNFIRRNPIQLIDKMSCTDQEIFNFDVRKIEWGSYMENYVCGIRTFLFNDDLSSLPAARKTLKTMKRLRNLTRLIIIGLTLLVFYVLWCNNSPHTSFTLEFENNTSNSSAHQNVLEMRQLVDLELCMGRQLTPC
ncbi:Fatty acyl-CoA reductase 1 [Daphnia magna]|uniref:Fatty acyl-CoA reductase n=1 Tax=Daphnia magna TaxID=35525 RepID=A0A162R1G3_9CRUS|nr:Fatty acyl-CoA reductase 1 [Daphnia magna]